MQVAATFANHVLPGGSGGLAVNVRFLRRYGLSRADAVGAVALNMLAGMVTHTALLRWRWWPRRTRSPPRSGPAVSTGWPATRTPGSWPRLLAVPLAGVLAWAARRWAAGPYGTSGTSSRSVHGGAQPAPGGPAVGSARSRCRCCTA